MIRQDDILSLSYMKKQSFTGSFRGMRYILQHMEDSIIVTVWPQPLSFAVSAEESRISERFPYSEEGRLSAIAWLNRMYEEKKEIWDTAGFVKKKHLT